MIFKVQTNLILLVAISTFLSHAQQIKYLNGVFENEVCEISKKVNGTCQKITNCMNAYENFRKNKTTLNICSYDRIESNTLICCPQQNKKVQTESFLSSPMNLNNIKSQNLKRLNLLDFESCRNNFLPYRKLHINNQHFLKALQDKILPLSEENCNLLSQLNANNSGRGSTFLYCNNGYLSGSGGAFGGLLVKKGDRPNMAAIGITQSHGSSKYICGGSIITDRFIVTAAHCKFYDGKQVNTVRVGDRYLLTKEDDEIAQSLHIQHFISHPSYKSNLKYNDIAMIKTLEQIRFNKFVVPSCIDNFNISSNNGDLLGLTVAGYGQTEDGVPSNILLEIGAQIIPNSKCNKTFENDDDLPYGIIDSQICVDNYIKDEKITKDTCYGDSGSPLQFKTEYEVFPEYFNRTYLSKVYITSTVLGIVSFGIGCGLKVPSVYTKLHSFRDWMKNVIENN